MTREIVTDGHHIPEPVKQWDYWVIWDFDLKQPRAPWENGHCYPSDWRQDCDVDPRTNYDQSKAAADLEPTRLHEAYPFPDGPPNRVGPTLLLPHAGADTPGPTPADPPLLFIDYDDVVVDGEIPDEVWEVAKSIGGPVFVSRSFLYGEEPAGLHQLARGTLPGAVTTLNESFDDRGHIEVYKKSRMTGFTWRHVRGTPFDELPDATDTVADVVSRYGGESTLRRSQADPTDERDSGPARPLKSQAELGDIDSTDDIQDVFDAISHVGPDDIRLRSTETSDGNRSRRSFDPSWEDSESGERLGYDRLDGGDGWIYRKGSKRVDALQVVAAEERITTDVTDYPEGEDFWKAVQGLRERGASVPYFEGESGTHPDFLRVFDEPESDEDRRRLALRVMRASGRQG